MAHRPKTALCRIYVRWLARTKSAAITRNLDAHALTELGFPPARPKFRLREWLATKL